ncbi:hypothetical protein BKA67DRAFT_363590 [Truncatella angustata]|uniref:Uncharacterized protein n=1 Tax=Truncatella angustata TaxID=152316 RepID=A0A9P8UEH6_9PEZI|nr:uncharacterized protein BKA67DRAFT_363590 [Truncatella angustata]KAH6648430.1 hypothetical protein BKA67DRAFT_363590 [Truncatella angustata]
MADFATESANRAQSTDSTIKAPESLADQLATDPDNTGDSVVSSAPINAETDAAKAPEEEAKQSPPKPVSVEVVQDAEGPTAKSAAVNDVAKPETTAANTASSAPKEAPQENDDTTTGGAQPTVTDGETKPDTVPVVSEPASVKPKTGAKRKAEEPATTNGEPGPEDKPAAAHPEKKQKSSPFKKALDKVSSAVKKGGRPKKEKKEPAPVGRTARVTRSQAKTD